MWLIRRNFQLEQVPSLAVFFAHSARASGWRWYSPQRLDLGGFGEVVATRGAPVSFTNSLKKLQMKEHGYPLARIRDCEEDHVVPLCLAGAPQDPANLWSQPRFGEWSADRKDTLEAKLCRLVCQ